MRKLWIRIGIGAGAVFATGLFVVTLARQVRSAAAEAIRNGTGFRVPLAILPFEVDGHKVGSVREIQVERSEGHRVKQIRITVNLKGFDGEALGDCALVLSGHHGHRGLFDCVELAEADADGYTQLGEVRFEPGGAVRPILIDRAHAENWFDGVKAGEVHIRADGSGNATVNVKVKR